MMVQEITDETENIIVNSDEVDPIEEKDLDEALKALKTQKTTGTNKKNSELFKYAAIVIRTSFSILIAKK